MFRGTFRRNGEGDYHCSREAVTAMLRDQCVETADTCLIDELTIGDLNADSIRRYRMMFGQIREGHAWTKLPDDEFLVKIGAARKDANGMVRPMLSGLVCFGDFGTISNVFPGYFLDYRERLGDGSRWTDRIAAHDPDWSGNIVAVKPGGQNKSAPKIAVKDAVKIAVKRTSPKARPLVIEKCAELYQWLKDDPQRTIQQAVSTLGYSERSIFNYLETLKDASALEHHGPANGGEWVFMI